MCIILSVLFMIVSLRKALDVKIMLSLSECRGIRMMGPGVCTGDVLAVVRSLTSWMCLIFLGGLLCLGSLRKGLYYSLESPPV